MRQEPPRASHKSFHTSTGDTWQLQDFHARASERGSHQDLQKIFRYSPVQDHARHLQGLNARFDLQVQGPLREDCARISAGHMIFLQGQPFFASLRGQKAHGQPARTDRTNAAPKGWDNRFERACAVEMHMDMSEEPFCARMFK